MKLYLSILVFGLLNCVHSLKDRALRVRNRLESGAEMRAYGPDSVVITYHKAEGDSIRIEIQKVTESKKFDSTYNLVDKLIASSSKLSADGYHLISAKPQGDKDENSGKVDMSLKADLITISYVHKDDDKPRTQARKDALGNLHKKLITVFDDFENGDKPRGPGKETVISIESPNPQSQR
eukprot:Platyproteum_vivax@DN7475_c1_g2_i1.p1